MIYSVRVVNEGSVPAQVRSVRLFLEKRRSRFQLGIPPWLVEERRSIPFPSVEEGEGDIVHNLWSNEKDATKALPYMLQQGDSVRFAAPYHTVATRLRDAGLHGTGSTYVSFRVGVVDALDDAHTVEDTMVVDAPQPEP
jgi:hypothetical protein